MLGASLRSDEASIRADGSHRRGDDFTILVKLLTALVMFCASGCLPSTYVERDGQFHASREATTHPDQAARRLNQST